MLTIVALGHTPQIVDVKALDIISLKQECIAARKRVDQLEADKFDAHLATYIDHAIAAVREHGTLHGPRHRALHGVSFSLIAHDSIPELLIDVHCKRHDS